METIIERPGEKILKFVRRGHEDYDRYVYVGSLWQFDDNVGQGCVEAMRNDPENMVFEVTI